MCADIRFNSLLTIHRRRRRSADVLDSHLKISFKLEVFDQFLIHFVENLLVVVNHFLSFYHIVFHLVNRPARQRTGALKNLHLLCFFDDVRQT